MSPRPNVLSTPSRVFLVLLFLTSLAGWIYFFTQGLTQQPHLASRSGRGPALSSEIPGVGFGLHTDYGTVSIHFANGTFVNIAKVDGSADYRQFMSIQEISEPAGILSVLCAKLADLLFFPSFCLKAPGARGVQSMLHALRVAAEEHLGTAFCYVGIAVPHGAFFEMSEYQQKVIDAALESLDLKRFPYLPDAAKLFAFYDGLDRLGREQLLLAIEYSRSGLIMTLLAEFDELVVYVLKTYRPDLGSGSGMEGAGLQNALAGAMKHFLDQPAERTLFNPLRLLPEAPEHYPGWEQKHFPGWQDVVVNPPHTVHMLLVCGESTADDSFRTALRKALGNKLVDSATQTFDPVFAGAMGMAKNVCIHLHYRWANDRPEPSWTCKRRSRYDWGDGGKEL